VLVGLTSLDLADGQLKTFGAEAVGHAGAAPGKAVDPLIALFFLETYTAYGFHTLVPPFFAFAFLIVHKSVLL